MGLLQCGDDGVVAGDLAGGQAGERAAFEVADGLAHLGGNGPARFGQDQAERAPVGGVQLAGQVAAPFQPVQHAGQRGRPGAGVDAELADVAGAATSEVRQRVELRRRQVQLGKRGAQGMQCVVRCSLQGQHHSGFSIIRHHGNGLYRTGLDIPTWPVGGLPFAWARRQVIGLVHLLMKEQYAGGPAGHNEHRQPGGRRRSPRTPVAATGSLR